MSTYLVAFEYKAPVLKYLVDCTKTGCLETLLNGNILGQMELSYNRKSISFRLLYMYKIFNIKLIFFKRKYLSQPK